MGAKMSRTVIDGRGVVTTDGSDGVSIDQHVNNSGFGPFALPVTALTANATVTTPGMYTLQGTTTPIVVTMPSASNVPGAIFVFKSLSAHFHHLTGSQEVGGTRVFCHMAQQLLSQSAFVTGSGVGSRCELRPVVGSSVVLLCDGTNYMVTAMSGTVGLFAP